MTFDIEVERESFADVVHWAARAIAVKPPNAILAGMRISAADGILRCEATDYETATTGTMPCPKNGRKHHAFEVIIPGKMLAEVLSRLDGPNVSLSYIDGGTRLGLACGRSKATFPVLPLDQYPTLPDPAPALGALDADVFADAVVAVTPFAAKDGTSRTNLISVALIAAGGVLSLGATDGVQMCDVRLPWTGPDGTVLVPVTPLIDAAKQSVGEVAYGWTGDDAHGSVTFTCADDTGSKTLTCRIIPGAPAPVGKYIEHVDHPVVAHMETDALIRAVKLAQAFVVDKQPIRLSLGLAESNLESDYELTLMGGGVGDSTIVDVVPAHVTGSPDLPVEFGLNPVYALNALMALDSKWCRLATGSAATRNAIRFDPADSPEDGPSSTRVAVLMPVRLSTVGGE